MTTVGWLTIAGGPGRTRLAALRRGHLPWAMGAAPDIGTIGPVGRAAVRTGAGSVDLVAIVVPLAPETIAGDLRRARAWVERAASAAVEAGADTVAIAAPLAASALVTRVMDGPIPATTGAATRAWTLWRQARRRFRERGGDIGVLGTADPAIDAAVALLVAEGLDVRVEARSPLAERRIRALGALPARTDEIQATCRIVIPGPGARVPDGAIAIRPFGVRLPSPLHAGPISLAWWWRDVGGVTHVPEALAEGIALSATGSLPVGDAPDADAVRRVAGYLEHLGFRDP